ncbi:MAG: tape measure protein [Tenuifilaceae bacterium]|jgi:tape measure domain-containing protein|nr:tape measure protein [Tenuifilaceae bacterium]
MPGLHFESSIDFQQLDRQLKVMETKISELARTTEKAGDDMDATFKRVGAAVGAYLSFQALSGFAMQVANVRGEFQQLEVAFNTMLGSKEKADKLMGQVVNLAATTPFSLTDVSQGVKQLLAYQESQETVIDTTKRLGDISAGLSVPLGRLIMVYGQVRAKGRLMGDDLRQFTEAGIPMIAELAKQFDVAESKVSEMVSAGTVGFADVQSVLKRLTDEGGMFFNLMEEQAKTITGLISNLGDAWDRMMNQIGENNEGLIAGSVTGLIELVENYEKVLDILKVLAVTYGTYKAAVVLATLAKSGMTAAEILHYGWIVMVQKAQALLNKTMLANPFVATATAVAALVSGLVIYNKYAREASQSQKLLADISGEVSAKMQHESNVLAVYRRRISETLPGSKERVNLVRELNDKYPDLLRNIDAENSSVDKLNGVFDTYIANLEKTIRLKVLEEQLTRLVNDAQENEAKFRDKSIDSNERYRVNKNLEAKRQELLKELEYQKDLVDYGEQTAKLLKEKRAIEQELAEIPELVNELRTTSPQTFEEFKREQEEIAQALISSGQVIGSSKVNLEQAYADYLATFDQSTNDYESKVNRLNEINKILEKGLTPEIEGQSIKTIEDLKKELSSLENAYNKATDINDQAELDRLAKLIIAKRQEIEKFKIESQKSDKRTDLEIFEDDLKNRKELYAQFEAYKKVVGEEEANQMYADLRKQGEDYITYLQSLLNTLPAGDKKAIVATEIVSTGKKADVDTAKDLAEILKRTATFHQQLLALDKKYQEEKELLEKEGATENLRVLTEQYEAERQALIESNRLKSESYQWIFADIERMNRQALKDYIQRLREEVNAKSWSDEAKLKLSEKLAQAEQKLADIVPERLKDVAGVLREAANLAGELDEELAKAINTAAELADAASNIAMGLATSNPFQVAGGIIQAATSLIKYFSSSEQIKQATEELTESLSKMNEQLERQARLLEWLGGADKLAAFTKMMGDLGQTADDTKKKLYDLVQEMSRGGTTGVWYGNLVQWSKGELGKAKEVDAFKKALSKSGLEVGNAENWTNDDWIRLIGNASGETKKQLEALYDQWVELQDKQEEYYRQWAEYSTGMSFDSFTSEFLEALKSGERSAADFADNVEDMLRNAIIQGFKTKYLIDTLEPWYKQFAQFSEDGLTPEEVTALRQTLQSVFADAASAFEALGDMGVDMTGLTDSANSLSGSIKGVSEETASILAGRLNSMHLTMNEHLKVAQRVLLYQAETAYNTKEIMTVSNLLYEIKQALTSNRGTNQEIINRRAEGR